MWKSLIDILPRGNTLSEADFERRHRLLLWVLVAHVPVLAIIGFALGNPPVPLLVALAVPLVCAGAGWQLRRHRRWGAGAVTVGLVWCSTTLVGITNGSIEAHFHFFIIIGFIALYQDWVPFLLNVLLTALTHGIGSTWFPTLIFNHPWGQANPWLWSLIHAVAVLLACVGVMLFWRVTEDEQNQKDDLTRKLADAEIGRRKFTSDMLVNLARRNQSMLYRQLEIINQLEESERNPDALAELFRLDHLTTRVRRNAENLLVLSGEKPPRVWSQPVPLRDVVRAAIAETEDLDRVAFEIPEGPTVDGASVTDLTHLLAELTENAVRFSPPDMTVTIRGRRDPRGGRGQLLTVEDWGVGMEDDDLAAANALLAEPPEVDLSVSKRLGFHVVARLAARHGIRVVLSPTPGSGITASIALPGSLFELGPEPVGAAPAASAVGSRPVRPAPRRRPDPITADHTAPLAPNGADVAVVDRPVPTRRVPDRGTGGWAAADRSQADRAVSERPAADRTGSDRTGTDRPTLNRRPRPDRALGRPAPGRAGIDATDTADADTERAGDAGADVRSLIPGPRMPLPSENGGQEPAERFGSWTGWWAGTDPTRGGSPDGATATIAADEDANGTAPDPTPAARPTLRRRTPQAHIAPGLRVVPADGEAADAASLPVAAEALSRYQASRAAAKSAVDDESTDERSSR